MDANRLLIAEPSAAARAALADALPAVTIVADNDVVARRAGCLVLAVKPQVLPEVCRQLAVAVQACTPLIVSIAAGVRAADIERWLGGNLAVVRVMPNQPALVRRGVSGMTGNSRVSAADRRCAESIMAAVGSVVWVDSDADIDTVTAVSGSGPAYFFLLIDVLAQAGVRLGLSSDVATSLALETARGAAELAVFANAADQTTMQQLIARVRSPGGTTAAALEHLEKADLRAIVAAAISAARDRAVELADDAHNAE
jgi:pyrroline-5-carboxylate reductase